MQRRGFALGILVNSGIRPGTESDGMCWKHVEHFKHVDGKEYPRIWVSGKTGERQLVAMPNVKKYLSRIKERRTEYLGHEPDINEPACQTANTSNTTICARCLRSC